MKSELTEMMEELQEMYGEEGRNLEISRKKR